MDKIDEKIQDKLNEYGQKGWELIKIMPAKPTEIGLLRLKYIFKRHSENGKEENILPNNSSWKSMFDSLNFFTTDYMNQRNQPDLEEREDLFSRNIEFFQSN